MSDSVAEDKTKSLGILSHLIEMRDRLLRAIIVVAIAFVCLFPFAKNIYNWLAAPLVDQGQEMLIIGPVAPFLIPMKLTLMVAFLIALPYLFYQLWSFVAPGLYKHEKRLIYPLIASSIFLFYMGIAFVYYLLLPMMFKIIPQFAPEVAVFSPDIAQYLDFTIMMFMAFGFGFEMPIATILLISTGMTTAEELKKKRPYVIIGAFIVGMLLTPPDVISQIMLAIPMWLLFELGLIFSKLFNVRVKEASNARKEMDESDSATTSTVAAAGASIVSDTPALSADTLWEDEDYTYEDSTSDYQDSDTFHMEPLDDKPETLTGDAEDDDFFDTEGFKELSDDEMDAELDAIEAEEQAQESKEKTKAVTKKPATKKKTAAKKPAKKAPAKKTKSKKTVAKKTPAKKAAPKKTTAKKAVTKKKAASKSTAKKTVAKKPAAKKTTAKKTVSKKTTPKKKS